VSGGPGAPDSAADSGATAAPTAASLATFARATVPAAPGPAVVGRGLVGSAAGHDRQHEDHGSGFEQIQFRVNPHVVRSLDGKRRYRSVID
jgi:hypothetical protein